VCCAYSEQDGAPSKRLSEQDPNQSGQKSNPGDKGGCREHRPNNDHPVDVVNRRLKHAARKRRVHQRGRSRETGQKKSEADHEKTKKKRHG